MGGKQLPQTIKINACQKILRIKCDSMRKNIKANHVDFRHNSTKEIVSYLISTDRIGPPKTNVLWVKYPQIKSINVYEYTYTSFCSAFLLPPPKSSGKLNDISKYQSCDV